MPLPSPKSQLQSHDKNHFQNSSKNVAIEVIFFGENSVLDGKRAKHPATKLWYINSACLSLLPKGAIDKLEFAWSNKKASYPLQTKVILT